MTHCSEYLRVKMCGQKGPLRDTVTHCSFHNKILCFLFFGGSFVCFICILIFYLLLGEVARIEDGYEGTGS